MISTKEKNFYQTNITVVCRKVDRRSSPGTRRRCHSCYGDLWRTTLLLHESISCFWKIPSGRVITIRGLFSPPPCDRHLRPQRSLCLLCGQIIYSAVIMDFAVLGRQSEGRTMLLGDLKVTPLAPIGGRFV